MKDKEESAVRALFSAIGIERVVYVDDRFGITRERIAALCREMTNQQIVASGAFPNLDPSVEEAVREERLIRAIDSLEEPRLVEIFDALGTAAALGAEAMDRQTADSFSTLLREAAQLELMSCAQWKARQLKLIAEAESTSTLFVFDDDFSWEGFPKDEGRRLIADLHSKSEGYKYAYALLTHNAQDDAGERQIEKEITDQHTALAGFVVVIAKARLSGDRQRFIQRLKSTLLFRLFSVLKTKLHHATESAAQEAMKEIDRLEVDAFEHIIFGSSQHEGAWSPETLVRIFGVVHERHVRTKLRGDKDLHSLIADIDPLCSVPSGGVSPAVAERAELLQRLEIYDDQDLNQFHLPLELGDIFQDTAGKRQYIVLAQPCDLVVRDNGLRKGTRDACQMVPLAEIKKHKRHKGGDGHLAPHEHELPHFGHLNYRACASLNFVFFLPIWLLDLAVLNEDGACSVCLEQKSPALLINSWRKRFGELIRRATAAVHAVNSIVLDEEKFRGEFLQSLLRLPPGTPFETSLGSQARGDGEYWTLNLGLKRIARLRERHSTAMLTHYGSYLTRLAHPHDLTNF